MIRWSVLGIAEATSGPFTLTMATWRAGTGYASAARFETLDGEAHGFELPPEATVDNARLVVTVNALEHIDGLARQLRSSVREQIREALKRPGPAADGPLRRLDMGPPADGAEATALLQTVRVDP